MPPGRRTPPNDDLAHDNARAVRRWAACGVPSWSAWTWQTSNTFDKASSCTCGGRKPIKKVTGRRSASRTAERNGVQSRRSMPGSPHQGISDGAVFRPVNRHGRIHDTRLSGEAIALVVRERVAAAGLDPAQYSGHSLRAGLATSAAQAGVPTWRIRAQTRHASDAMLARYIRDGEMFTDNAAGALL